jgi:hypothetical protein
VTAAPLCRSSISAINLNFDVCVELNQVFETSSLWVSSFTKSCTGKLCLPSAKTGTLCSLPWRKHLSKAASVMSEGMLSRGASYI